MFIFLFSIFSFAAEKEDQLTLGDMANFSGIKFRDILYEIEANKGLKRGIEENGYIFRLFYADELVDEEIIDDLASRIKKLINPKFNYTVSLFGYASRKPTDFPGGKPRLAYARALKTKESLAKKLSGEKVVMRIKGFDVLGPEHFALEWGKYQYVEARLHVNMPFGKDCNTTIEEEFQGLKNPDKLIHVGGASKVSLSFNSFSTPDSFFIKGIHRRPVLISTEDYSDNPGLDAAMRLCLVESAKVNRKNDCDYLIKFLMISKELDHSILSKVLIKSGIPDLEPVRAQFISYLKGSHAKFSADPKCSEALLKIDFRKLTDIAFPDKYLNGYLNISINSMCGTPKWKLKIDCL